MMRPLLQSHRAILRALAGHYRRHPIQAIFLVVGLAIATVLLVATQLINAQAQASYSRGASLMAQQPVGYVVAAQGQKRFSINHYVALRRAGFDHLVPVLQSQFATQQHGVISVMGVDWLALSSTTQANTNQSEQQNTLAMPTISLEAFILPPYRLLMAPARMTQLNLTAGESMMLVKADSTDPAQTKRSTALPAVVPAPEHSGLGHQTVMDLYGLQDISQQLDQLSAIWVMSEHQRKQLIAALPATLSYKPAATPVEQAGLANSLHLNLAAMGLLSFVVGLFLAFNAIQFSYTDRQPLLRRLRLSGVSKRQLMHCLLVELAVFVSVGCLLGYGAGIWLASLLLPGLGQTLAQLYDIYIAYPNSLIQSIPALPLVMVLSAAAFAYWPMRQLIQQPLLARYRHQHDQAIHLKRDRLLIRLAGIFCLFALSLQQLADGLWLALLCLACVLLAGALCLPMILRWSLAGLQRLIPNQRPLLQWLLADSRWLLGPAAVSLMAMTLALVANSGLNSMITSFRAATEHWLDQRLVAPIYLDVEAGQQHLGQWLSENAPDVAIAERHTLIHSHRGGVEIASLPPLPTFTQSIQLLEQQPQAVEQFAQGHGIYVSERYMRLDGGEIGQSVHLCDAAPDIPIVGSYRDYGNPRSQWLLDEHLFRRCWPLHRAKSTALLLADAPDKVSEKTPPYDWHRLIQQLSAAELITPEQVIDQQQVRQVVLSIFEQTFTITEALNGLTLLVAGIGIFCATSAIHHHRVRQQAQLAALGVSHRQRIGLLLCQWGLLATLSMLVVWPFGTLLAWVLSDVVTPAAFGWSFATLWVWHHYPLLAALAIGCVLAATVIPTLRLKSVSIASLLKEVDE